MRIIGGKARNEQSKRLISQLKKIMKLRSKSSRMP